MSEIINVDITKLESYKRLKTSLYEGERLEDMVNSVKNFGIMIPIIVRTIKDSDRYEILSGHNRVNAAKIAGKKNVPVIIKKDLPDEFADIYFICTNLYQRSFRELKISEQAFAVALKYTQLFDSKKVKDITDELKALSGTEKARSPVGNGTRTMDIAGNDYGISRNSVARLLRINKLSDQLKTMVDNGNIKIRPAVELSYLSEDMQKILMKAILANEVNVIDMKMAKQLREVSESYAEPSEEVITEVICGTYDDDEKPKEKGEKVTIPKATYTRYLGGYSKKEANLIIEKALAYYFEKNEEETA